jgi:hypothetical protein
MYIKCGCNNKFPFEICLGCRSIIQECNNCITFSYCHIFNEDLNNFPQIVIKFLKILNSNHLFCKKCVLITLYQYNENNTINFLIERVYKKLNIY